MPGRHCDLVARFHRRLCGRCGNNAEEFCHCVYNGYQQPPLEYLNISFAMDERFHAYKCQALALFQWVFVAVA